MASDPFTHSVAPPPLPRPSRSEAFFQALLDGLLMLLYMTGVMVLVSDVLEIRLSFVGWGIQGVVFATVFVGLRMRMTLAGPPKYNDPIKLKRNRWVFFALSGAMVAADCLVKLALGRSWLGPELGLLLAAVAFAVVGLIGLSRANRG
ncbi:MAG: hypothetical protein AB7O59_07000 [Pirellulales bacterium]